MTDLKIESPESLVPHPLASDYPTYTDEEAARMDEGLRRNGCALPIALIHVGKGYQILDGVQRLKRCLEIGVKPRFQDWKALSAFKTPEEYVRSCNDLHRNMSKSQYACVAALRLQRREIDGTKPKRGRPPKQTNADINNELNSPVAGLINSTHDKANDALSEEAKKVCVGRTSVGDAQKLLREAEDLFWPVHRGEGTVEEAILQLRGRNEPSPAEEEEEEEEAAPRAPKSSTPRPRRKSTPATPDATQDGANDLKPVLFGRDPEKTADVHCKLLADMFGPDYALRYIAQFSMLLSSQK